MMDSVFIYFQWGVTSLIDNKTHHKVFYKISVFTGMRQGAGTKSKICFILSGEGGDTGIRIAEDGSGKVITRISFKI